MIKLATWNVNSLKIRLVQVLDWLDSSGTDILALQETKLIDENFPREAFEEKGYNVIFSGQKTYNGVAVISRFPLTDVLTDIPGLDDPQRRIIAASIQGLRLVNLYVPNGSEVSSEKYQYKLHWLEIIQQYLKDQLKTYSKLAVVGDFNIAPDDRDVHDPKAWEGCVLVSPAERKAFQQLLDIGLNDSFRVLHPEDTSYTWWDYRAAAFRRNLGLRIDHILLSEELMKKCDSATVDKAPRKNERPSDHTPMIIELSRT